jgi:nitrate reductase NapE
MATPLDDRLSRRREGYVFVFLTVVLAPVLAVAVVGGYGFLVWMYQLIAGPPKL